MISENEIANSRDERAITAEEEFSALGSFEKLAKIRKELLTPVPRIGVEDASQSRSQTHESRWRLNSQTVERVPSEQTFLRAGHEQRERSEEEMLQRSTGSFKDRQVRRSRQRGEPRLLARHRPNWSRTEAKSARGREASDRTGMLFGGKSEGEREIESARVADF